MADAKLKLLKPRIATLDTRRVSTLNPDSWRGDKQGANARGYTYRWQQARDWFLRQHPLCQCSDCDEGRKRARPSTVVDHKVPHRGDQTLFWKQDNWMAMAKACHDAKTAQERLTIAGVQR